MKEFSIIAAIDQQMGIGKNGTLPWHLPEDLKYFNRITKEAESGKENAVIMGRRTWESLPEKFRPLPGRINAVISSNSELELPDGVLHFDSLDAALTAMSTSSKIDQVFVIGGAKLYQEAVLHPELERIYLTRIESVFKCDTFFPDQIPEEFEIVSTTDTLESDGLEYNFVILEKDIDHSNDVYIETN